MDITKINRRVSHTPDNIKDELTPITLKNSLIHKGMKVIPLITILKCKLIIKQLLLIMK